MPLHVARPDVLNAERPVFCQKKPKVITDVEIVMTRSRSGALRRSTRKAVRRSRL